MPVIPAHMGISRSQYLESWTRYPVVDSSEAGEVVKGRYLSQSAEAVELLVQRRKMSYFHSLGERLGFLRPGDWISCRLSPEGRVSEVQLLAPNLRQDFAVSKAAETHALWMDFLETVRGHLKGQGLQEVQTPGLVVCPGLEPHLNPFATLWLEERLYLPTSPEIHLKKLLCRGYESVFEIRKVYRNEFSGPSHRPEFTMLEWYQSFLSLEELALGVKTLVQTLANNDLSEGDWRSTTVRELFQLFAGLELQPNTGNDELMNCLRRHSIEFDETSCFDDLFQLLWVELIEENLREVSSHLLIFDFPPSQAALARLGEGGWADRFELYWNGVECANAYQELNDPVEQLTRFQAFQSQRSDDVPIDEEFIQHLQSGMPPAAGVAIGLERLFMALHGVQDIQTLYEF